MRRMILAGLCALCCILTGLLQQRKHAFLAETAREWLGIVDKMAEALHFSPQPLPEIFRLCAPREDHFLHRFAGEMERQPAVPAQHLLGPCPLPEGLSPALGQALARLLCSLQSPGHDRRNEILSETLHLWKEETQRLEKLSREKGPLSLKLSLLAGCAMFILLC